MMTIRIRGAGQSRYPVNVIDTEATKVIVCRGALATERRLLTEVDRLVTRNIDDLGTPVRIIVPSRSLRLHLMRRLVSERGAVAGVVIQTVSGAVHEILKRTGREMPIRQAAHDLTVRWAAEEEPALADELDGLTDGYDVVLGAIRDLVDAGFTPENEAGVLDQLTALADVLPGPERRRAEALVRVATRVHRAGREFQIGPHAALIRAAAEILRDQGAMCFPSRACLVHGFADVTGVVADVLEALIGATGAVALIDRPADPAEPGSEDAGVVYLDRLDTTLGGLPRETDPTEVEPPIVDLVAAPDVESEARRAAEWARGCIAGGADPEDVGIVVRRLDTLAAPLRRHLHRLGVPFSGVGAEVPGGRIRTRMQRLADLLRRGGEAEVELWFDLADASPDGAAVLLGLRVLSLGRVRDLAALSRTDGRLSRGVPLPAGVVAPAGNDVRRRGAVLAGSRVVDAIEGARRLLEVVDEWRQTDRAAAHLSRFRRFVAALHWNPEDEAARTALDCATTLTGEYPIGMDIGAEEWRAELVKRLDGLGSVAIGGKGGGVQVLTVMEARARTFEHLSVCGLNRGIFPRLAVDDPMLPDPVRARLAGGVLPQMPVKARSADEERYLFAQLVSSTPRLTLSWHGQADGRKAAPSPFVDRLIAAVDRESIERAAPLWSADPRPSGPRPPYEHAVITAAAETEFDLGSRYAEAAKDGQREAPSGSWTLPAQRLATARLDVVAAVETGPEGEPGPWSGFVGGSRETMDLMWVTRLEATATCPWQAFLDRRLGIRPLPDPHMGLPDPDHRLLGLVVHQALEAIVTGGERAGKTRLGDALEREPKPVHWPGRTQLERWIVAAAEEVVYREGLGGFGLSLLLAARARPLLEVAKQVEWDRDGRLDGVLGVEVEAHLKRPGIGFRIGFRADRVDLGPRLTDYKTGKPMSIVKDPGKRADALFNEIRTGRMLQAVAYALASPGGVGRYVWLKPDIKDAPEECRVAEAEAAEERLTAAFDAAVAVIEGSLAAGVVFPRVEEPGGGKADHCRHCRVSEACRRDDSRFRHRLVRLMEGDREAKSGAESIARRLWWLGVEGEEVS
jgi:hypothetical protein